MFPSYDSFFGEPSEQTKTVFRGRAYRLRKLRALTIDNNRYPRIIEELVRYVYTGQLHLTRENVVGVLHLALIWKMDRVVDWCAAFITFR